MEPTPLEPAATLTQGTSGPVYSYPQEWIQLNVFEILTIIREARDEQRRTPPGSWVLGSFSTFLAFGLCVIATSQYRAAFGFSGGTWASVLLFFTILTGAGTVALFAWWIVAQFRTRPRTDREIVQELIDEMQKARAEGRVFLGR